MKAEFFAEPEAYSFLAMLRVNIKNKKIKKYWLGGMLFLTAVSMSIALFFKPLHFYAQTKTQHLKNNPHLIAENPIKPLIKPSAKIILPANMQVVNALQHTSVIGTTDNPTMDGGIINAADGMAVYHPAPPAAAIMQQQAQENKAPENTINQNNFNDDWAKAPQVKMLLNAAVNHGLDQVLKKTDALGMPASVATVPMIESGYRNNAVSPKGAAGVWQLMPETAKDDGVNNQERFDLNPATDAALKLLQNLHAHYGNWTLAFAAYNAGQKRVDDALVKNPQAKSIDELNLPQETKAYVHKMRALNQALLQLGKAHA